ncbi:MAG: HAMP domain-containing histidine kinase [Muribaculaceae bacterium]|nr:HAMP domain-containing histidine kinase [Muribaculaceae bacterium]
MKTNIYEIRRYGRWVLLTAAVVLAAVFLYLSDRLIKDLGRQERERMEIWANATKQSVNMIGVVVTDSASMQAVNEEIDFLLEIMQSNTTIPVLLADDDDNILLFRNFSLPEAAPDEAYSVEELSRANRDFLNAKLSKMRLTTNVIHITIEPGVNQHLYYEDSTLLKRMSYYPYVQLGVMLMFILVVYFAVVSTKKAEQNKVWVGLSKETAHQLGTPISSLMAWMELLPDLGVDAETVGEMNKDVQRLSTIASRFSKIGSEPKMEDEDLNAVVGKASAYMATRISPRIEFSAQLCPGSLPVKACAPLFEWVMENLLKNAVDATEGHGRITVTTSVERDRAIIDVTDTGKGIPRKEFDNVFSAGYTTKKRGWGLGLTLAKRIIEQYHRGKIYVKQSTVGQGTTFRIEIPLAR